MKKMKTMLRVKLVCLFCLFAALAITATAVAQEGYPLTGVWYGDWGPTPAQRTQVTFEMSWDGKKVSGIINPGPDSTTLATALLDSTKWTVHIESDIKDAKGATVHFVADGKLDNIGSYNRTISGTWTQGTVKGDFRLKRD